jgi:hypothetical protein
MSASTVKRTARKIETATPGAKTAPASTVKLVTGGRTVTAKTAPAPVTGKTAPKVTAPESKTRTAKPAPKVTAPAPAPKVTAKTRTAPAPAQLKPRVRGFKPYNPATLYEGNVTSKILPDAPVLGWERGRVDWLDAPYHLAIFSKGKLVNPGELAYPGNTYYRTVSYNAPEDIREYVDGIVKLNTPKVLSAGNVTISVYRNGQLFGQNVGGKWTKAIANRAKPAPAKTAKTAPKVTAKPAPARSTRTAKTAPAPAKPAPKRTRTVK